MVNIFQQGKRISLTPFYFKDIGDQVQGTYIGKRPNTVKDNFGNDQNIYMIEAEDGVKLVGFKVASKPDKQMEYVKPGQIIGLKYAGKVKWINKKNGNKETESKDIQLFADPKIVDQAWLDAHEGGDIQDSLLKEDITPVDNSSDEDETNAPSGSGFGDFDTPVPQEGSAAAIKNEQDKLREIALLASNKLNITDSSKIKDAVMEATGIAFIPANYDDIISQLKEI